jgi:hypothetical protein
MQPAHQPKISRRSDGTWVVECAECRADVSSDIPIGIGMPLVTRETAERLQENHAGPYGRRLAS